MIKARNYQSKSLIARRPGVGPRAPRGTRPTRIAPRWGILARRRHKWRGSATWITPGRRVLTPRWSSRILPRGTMPGGVLRGWVLPWWVLPWWAPTRRVLAPGWVLSPGRAGPGRVVTGGVGPSVLLCMFHGLSLSLLLLLPLFLGVVAVRVGAGAAAAAGAVVLLVLLLVVLAVVARRSAVRCGVHGQR
jgi:hypothetical protein